MSICQWQWSKRIWTYQSHGLRNELCIAFRHRDPLRGRLIETLEVLSAREQQKTGNENTTCMRYNAAWKKEVCFMS